MSGTKCDGESITIKTDPVDSLEEGSYNGVPLCNNNKSDYLQKFSNVDPQRGHSKNEPVKGDIEDASFNSKEIAEKLMKLKRSDSDDDAECGSDFTLTDFQEVELSDSYEEIGYHSFECDSPRSIETLNIEESEDRKPSQEELEIYSRSSDLKVSANFSSATSYVKNNVDKTNNTSRLHDLNLCTPRVVLRRLSVSQLSCSSSSTDAKPSLTKKNKCKSMFAESEIMKPIFNDAGVLTSYQCLACSKKFIKRTTLRQHFITHTDRFACPYCVARCKSKGDLVRHIQTHTKQKPFHCSVCNTNYVRESILKKHMKTQRHLRALFEQKNLVHMEMIRKKHVASPFVTAAEVGLGLSCKLCQKVAFSRLEYRKHVKSHTLKFICDICQKGCRSLPLLKMHKKTHSRSTSLTCKICFRSCSNFHCLKQHSKSHKPGSFNTVIKRPTLKASISKQRIFPEVMAQLHRTSQLRSAEGDQMSADAREFKCNDCLRRFSSSRQLTAHKCMPEDTFICGICNKTFSSTCKLKIHLKLHSRIIKCDICDIMFCEQTELEEHIQEEHVHNVSTGAGHVDAFTCVLCYDHFENASDLKDHMKDHAPTMLFSGKTLVEKKAVLLAKETKRSNSACIVDEDINTKVAGESVLKRPQKVQAPKYSFSDDDSVLDSKDFHEMLDRALAENNEIGQEEGGNASDTNLSDTDVELYSQIKAAFEKKVLNSDESELDELGEANVPRKPLFDSHEDIMNEYCKEFEMYSEIDANSQSFKCILCCKVFRKDKYLKNHLKHHVCEFCNVFFNDRKMLTEHKSQHEKRLVSQIRAERKRLRISKNQKRFSTASSASEHEFETKVTNCDVESRSSQAKSDASLLITLSHDEILQANKHNFENFSFLCPSDNRHGCKICKREYARPTTLTRHMKTHVCEFCGKFFEDKFDLFEHRYSHRKKAAQMKAKITGRDAILRPYAVVSKANRIKFKKYSFIDYLRNIYQCTLCQKDFVRRTVLTRHLKTHICARCDKFYEDKNELAKHYLQHPLRETNLEVEIADNAADSDELSEVGREEKLPISSIVQSEEVSLNDKTLFSYIPQPGISLLAQTQSSYIPQSDKAMFLEVRSLKDYEAAGEMSSVLPNANMLSFQAISILNPEHLATAAIFQDNSKKRTVSTQPAVEDRDRPFQCGECGKKFLKSSHLLSHLTIHTGDRPFLCNHCDKTFGRGSTLMKHMRTHRKPCRICGSIFTSKFELDLHMAVHRTATFFS
ncbi:hypothetical protein BsWGS_13130 [Bradybaena similaris]